MATNAHGHASLYTSQDLSSGLRLVAPMRRPRTCSKSFRCFEQLVQLPFRFFWREFDGLVQEIHAPPTPREVVLKLNAEIAARNMKRAPKWQTL